MLSTAPASRTPSKRKTKKSSKLFYACYLLLSVASQASNIVYIGSTPDPIRRLRQHNGEIAGGAKKTIKKRPWEMVVVVYGFPSRLAALQFEWAWQNPHKSRHFKSTGDNDEVGFQGKQKERFLPYKLRALAKMFHLEHYKRWPLHLHFTSNAVYEKFKVLKDLPMHVRVTSGPLSTIPFEELFTNNAETETYDHCYCSICESELNLQSQDWLQCIKENCPMVSHIVCLSSHFLKQDQVKEALIPVQGTCPYCEKELKWGELIIALKSRKLKLKSTASMAKVLSSSLQTSEVNTEQVLSEDDEESDSEKDNIDNGYENIIPVFKMTPRKKAGTGKELQNFFISDDESDDEIQMMKRSLSNLDIS